MNLRTAPKLKEGDKVVYTADEKVMTVTVLYVTKSGMYADIRLPDGSKQSAYTPNLRPLTAFERKELAP